MTKRKYKEGIDRQQGYLLPPRMDDYISEDNAVRAIDVYVESLDITELGFTNADGELRPGQPAYPPKALMKLYLYGYLNRIRSSRRLEAECRRNLEVMWLIGGMYPSYKTIANFRKDNRGAIQSVNQDFVKLCKELDLFGKEIVGIDGSFFRGNVGKKSIYTAKRLQKALQRIEQDITKYLQEMDQSDREEGDCSGSDPNLGEKLDQLRERQKKRKEQLQKLKDSGEKQIAEVDEDARLMSKKGHGTIAGYNVQTVIDKKHKLIVAGEVVQEGNDEQQLAPMGQVAKAALEVEKLTTVQDQGYFNSQHIKTCMENGIIPYVPEPDKQSHARLQNRFTRDEFRYDKQKNCYYCPAGQVLKFSTSYKRNNKIEWVYRSSVPVCRNCPLKMQCLPQKAPRRTISRWEHEEIIETHRIRMEREGKEMMRLRAQLCEHPFGTIKQWLGWQHFLLRGVEKVRAEFSLMMLSYNFRRVLNILGMDVFRTYCQARRVLRAEMSG